MSGLKVDGINIYYEVHGQGEPLVLIAGLTAHSQHWTNQLTEFAKHYQIILLDNRNAGQSDTTENGSIKTMADDVIALLDHLKINAAHILGRSMGGYIAQEIAINYPTRVNKLILEATAPVTSMRNNLLFEHFINLKQMGLDDRIVIKEFLFWENSSLLINNEKLLTETIEAIVADPYAQSKEGFKNQIKAIKDHDTRDRLANITAPTLVISGLDDILITPKDSQALVSGINNAEWEGIEGAGHGIHSDQALRFNQTVLDFLGNH